MAITNMACLLFSFQVHRLVAPRDQKYQSNFVEFKRSTKVVYRRYAGLFFCVCVDANDNELAYLEAIHFFVEVLDQFFGNVCELDLVFNFYKVRVFWVTKSGAIAFIIETLVLANTIFFAMLYRSTQSWTKSSWRVRSKKPANKSFLRGWSIWTSSSERHTAALVVTTCYTWRIMGGISSCIRIRLPPVWSLGVLGCLCVPSQVTIMYKFLRATHFCVAGTLLPPYRFSIIADVEWIFWILTLGPDMLF